MLIVGNGVKNPTLTGRHSSLSSTRHVNGKGTPSLVHALPIGNDLMLTAF